MCLKFFSAIENTEVGGSKSWFSRCCHKITVHLLSHCLILLCLVRRIILCTVVLLSLLSGTDAKKIIDFEFDLDYYLMEIFGPTWCIQGLCISKLSTYKSNQVKLFYNLLSYWKHALNQFSDLLFKSACTFALDNYYLVYFQKIIFFWNQNGMVIWWPRTRCMNSVLVWLMH